MPRAAASLEIEPWAQDGGTNRAEIPDALRRDGWGQEYSLPGGKTGPERVYVSQLLNEITSYLDDWNRHGPFMPWSPRIDYRHDDETAAFVTGPDGNLYVSTAASGPSFGNAETPGEGGLWRVY